MEMIITKTVEGEGEPTFPNPAVGVVGRHKETGDQELRTIFPVEDINTARWVAESLRKGRDILASQPPTGEELATIGQKDWSARQLFLAGTVELAAGNEKDRIYQAHYSETVPAQPQAEQLYG